MDKPFYKSKTFWFNVASFGAAVAENFGYTGVVPDAWQPFILPATAGINILLRFITRGPISLRR